MQEIITSTLLEYEKSTFLLDIVKHKNQNSFVAIRQTIENVPNTQELKINLSVLTDIIFVLQAYKKLLDENKVKTNNSFFSDEKQKAIVNLYYKGIGLDDLALKYDCSKQIIEQILFNKDIEIVNNSYKPSKVFDGYKKRR